ncbi:biotin/lipoyl-containing protein [Cupriavidus sp. PET2-C1]
MNPLLIERLVRQSEACATIGEVEYESDGEKLVLRFMRSYSVLRAREDGGQVPGSAKDILSVNAASNRRVVRAPATGIVFGAHPLSEQPSASPGSTFVEGQQLAFLQVGGVVCCIEADSEGVLGEMLVSEGSLVGFGDAVYELR